MIIEGWVLMKGATLAGSIWGAWVTYRTFPIPATKIKLMKCFRLGKVYLVKEKKKGQTIEQRIYPKIKSVRDGESLQVVFALPMGLNPDVIFKNDWLFYQAFGEHHEIQGNAKIITLNVYQEGIKLFDFNYDEFKDKIKDMKLPIVVGKSRQGYEVYDMLENPHLLIAGETGSGKSVCLRSILSTLILSESYLELYCADLKRSEFHLFRKIAREVVVDAHNLKIMLMKIKKELVRRGNLLDEAEVAHVDDLKNKLPYIVIAIDEVALLKKENDCMEILEEISAIGRALGVFLILSMQRPDADILDGKLKNNLTVRMAFRHSDKINSGITIGSGEAATIKQSQKGSMIYKSESLKAVQAPYLELSKAKKLLENYKRPTLKGEPIDVEFTVIEDDDTLDVL
jgi:S-DNA-T family DNA segregation ATPase FtsK/SpoIIIE